MKNLTIIVIVTCLFSIAFAGEKEGITIDLKISPAGSFQLTSQKTKGTIIKSGPDFLAKDFEIPVKPFTSDIDLRDNHVKEQLQVKKYPYVTVKAAKGNGGKGRALIKIRNVEKTIPFEYTEISKELVKVNFKISLKEYQFKSEDLSYMGAYVEDEISIQAILAYKKK